MVHIVVEVGQNSIYRLEDVVVPLVIIFYFHFQLLLKTCYLPFRFCQLSFLLLIKQQHFEYGGQVHQLMWHSASVCRGIELKNIAYSVCSPASVMPILVNQPWNLQGSIPTALVQFLYEIRDIANCYPILCITTDVNNACVCVKEHGFEVTPVQVILRLKWSIDVTRLIYFHAKRVTSHLLDIRL